MNSAERQPRGAAKARHYHLTPELAEYGMSRELGNYAQELMEWGEPDVIVREEMLNAGRDEQEAADLETITQVVARSEEAFIVSADAERAGAKKAREMERLAESDETPFTPNRLAKSVTDLRVQLVEALISTGPEAIWRHAELMWIAGVKRNSVGALIQKSCYAPAVTPTFKPVPVEGKKLHAAVKKKCVEERGAPVAWLNGRGEVITSFGRAIPPGAQGVLLNLGKKYIRREQARPVAESDESPGVVNEEPVPEAPATEAELALQEQKRGEKRAQREMIPRLRGCIRARGWRYIPGPYGYWERGEHTHTNTWEGMVEALLEDSQWARQEQGRLQAEEGGLIAYAAQLGAVVVALSGASIVLRKEF
jgi:hypothetical protein